MLGRLLTGTRASFPTLRGTRQRQAERRRVCRDGRYVALKAESVASGAAGGGGGFEGPLEEVGRGGVFLGSGKMWELVARVQETPLGSAPPQPGASASACDHCPLLEAQQGSPGASESLAGTAVEPDRKVGPGMWWRRFCRQEREWLRTV